MQNLSGLTLARVIKFHPHDNSCDCQSLYDGGRWTAVPLMTSSFSSSSGSVDWHEPEGNDWDKGGSGSRDVIAIIGKVHDQPIVLGFLAKPVSEMMFRRKNFRVDRHSSDVYSTIDGEGNIELAHPSGTFVRIGTSPEHEDLTGKDWDKKWKVKRNTDKPIWLSITVANQGAVKATFRVSPDGDVTMAATSLTINAPVAINGPSLTHNGVNIGHTHVHGGVAGGSSDTSTPS